MKKITNLLIVCSLALAGAAMAQQPMPEESPSKKAPDKKPPAEMKPPTHAPKPQAPVVKEPVAKEPAVKEAPATHTPAAPKLEKKDLKPVPPAAPETKASDEQPAAIATPAAKNQHPPQSKKDMKKAPVADTSAIATPPAAKMTPAPATAKPTPATAAMTPAAPASASAAPSVAQTNPATAPVNPAAAKKPDVQKVEQIKQQHANFHALPKPDKVPAVTFTANLRIQGSDRWQGSQYEVYRSYHPERHDQGWYHSRYQRVELISGGYYYFNNGYWYPAWGYNPTHEYYAYDAPIYAGKHAEPPDKVIADVQAALQEMGYYKGEVDGLLGPLTREAVTGYQADQGLTATAVIDEPTLDSLGMG